MNSMRICIFGDSIVHGVMDAEGGGWATRLMIHFWEHWDEYETNVYPLGIDAETAAGLLKRLDVEAMARKPDVIICAIGINDSSQRQDGSDVCSEKDFIRDIDALITQAKQYTSQIVFVGLTRVNENKSAEYLAPDDWVYTNERIEAFDLILKDAAAHAGALCIPCADVVPVENLPDRLHPDAVGHQKLFEYIRDVLLEKGIVLPVK